MTDWPWITIVTPSFNQGQFLEETIRSVLLQGYPKLEYIIIDGGIPTEASTSSRSTSLGSTYWVSERDGGQADAINKGFAACTGELLGFINSDDLYAMGALRRLSTIWEAGRTPERRINMRSCSGYLPRMGYLFLIPSSQSEWGP